MRRLGVAAALVVALLAVSQRGVETIGPVRQLAPGVYSRQGDIAREFRQPANMSWVEFKDFVVVIDATTPFGAKAVLPEIRKTTSKPIKYVFDTHYHWDHTQGNSVLVDEGVTVICSQGCAKELSGPKGQGEWNSGAKRTDQFSLAPYRFDQPTLTFGDLMVIDDGERRLELRLVGPGHTIGDAVAYLPKEQILFTGDLVVNWKFGNNVADPDADIPHWSKILLDMAAWDVKTVIPGHGDPGTTATLRGQSAFLTDLWTQVAAGKKAGKTLEELQKEVNLSKNGDWAADPSQNQSAIRAAFRNRLNYCSSVAEHFFGVAAFAAALYLLPRSMTSHLVSAAIPNSRPPMARSSRTSSSSRLTIWYGDLSAYGQAAFQTPSLDRLAREGIRFTNYYAGSTVCAPSRTTLMTGLHTGHAWIRGNGEFPLRAGDVTIAEVLRRAGYRTAVIGKWGLGQPGTTGQPDKKGFEYAFGFLDHRHAHRQYTDHLFRNGERIATDLDNQYVNDLFTAEARTFIEAGDARPFFLYLNYTVPHAELRVPEDSLKEMQGKFPEKPFVNAAADARPTGPDGPSLGYRSQPMPKAAFAAMITRMDRDIGRLTDAIDARGVRARTLVMFVSDNGPHQEGGADPAYFKSSGGLRGIKRDLYEGGIRVPMIARLPGAIPAGEVSNYAAAHWDLFPTLAAMAGATVPAGLDGLSIAAALRGQAQLPHDFLYWEFHERGFQQAVRMGPWKAVRLKKDAPLELYNLDTDPAETTDVAASQRGVVAKIENYLKTARTDSPNWPVK